MTAESPEQLDAQELRFLEDFTQVHLVARVAGTLLLDPTANSRCRRTHAAAAAAAASLTCLPALRRGMY